MNRIDIAPRGDVIPVVQGEVELRVNSDVLTLCSPVSTALLGPNFAEGQTQGTSADPKPVSLPDDDARAMTMLCQALHQRNAELKRPTPACVAIGALAITADKYDCLEAIHFTMEAWLSRIYISHSNDPWALLHAAYLLGFGLYFHSFTATLVNMAREPEPPLYTACEVQKKIHGAVQHRRHEVRHEINSAIATVTHTLYKFTSPEYDHYIDNDPGVEPFAEGEDVDIEEFVMPEDGSRPKKCTYYQQYANKHLPLLQGDKVYPTNVNGPYDDRTIQNLLNAIADFDIEAATRRDWEIKHCWPNETPCREQLGQQSEVQYYYPKAVRGLKSLAKKQALGLSLGDFKAM